MTDVVVACSDLMTASRFESSDARVQRCSTEDRALEAVVASPGCTCVIDLLAFPDLAERLHEMRKTGPPARILGFAPHVHEELLEAARQWCDSVYPRGAMVKNFARIVGG